ncbi:MAG: hypothetical protein ABI369_02865 [Acetobacteraceae bacterium]
MRAMVGVAAVLFGGFAGGPAWAQGVLPDPAPTPGAINPAVMQANIGATICVRGWTRTVRPPEEYTYRLKREQMRAWGYTDRRLRDFEEDHLVSLGLGGAPYDHRNLWPEPRHTADGWDADRKDELEAELGRLVCTGRVSLTEAQRAMATDWIAAWRRYVGLPGATGEATGEGE